MERPIPDLDRPGRRPWAAASEVELYSEATVGAYPDRNGNVAAFLVLRGDLGLNHERH